MTGESTALQRNTYMSDFKADGILQGEISQIVEFARPDVRMRYLTLNTSFNLSRPSDAYTVHKLYRR